MDDEGPITIEQARTDIQYQLEHAGTYSHNIISCTLIMVENGHGVEAANALVKELQLYEQVSISSVEIKS